MSIQTIANRWIEEGDTPNGIKPILLSSFQTLSSGPGYCETDNNTSTKLPGQLNGTNQIILNKTPYGPVNCNQYATLVKPGIHPLTLRGISTPGTEFPVNDFGFCAETRDYTFFDLIPQSDQTYSADQKCKEFIGNYCNGGVCENDAPGGLADWLGNPKENEESEEGSEESDNSGITWRKAFNDKLSGGKMGLNNYENPIKLVQPELLKYGFITDGCECQKGTERLTDHRGLQFHSTSELGPEIISAVTLAASRLPGGGPAVPIILGLMEGSTSIPKDGLTSSEVWNGENTCNTWQNKTNDYFTSTCNLNIQKYAKTCKWCKQAQINLSLTNLNKGLDYPKYQQVEGEDYSRTLCTFDNGGNGEYTMDKGECFGFSATGVPRIPCQKPAVDNVTCPRSLPLVGGGYTVIPQKIGMLCNVPAERRLVGGTHALTIAQGMLYMTKDIGENMNNYWISYREGPLSISINLNGNTPAEFTAGTGSSIVGGKQIAITFPNNTNPQVLRNYLISNNSFNSNFYLYYASDYDFVNPVPLKSIPPPISKTFNTSLFDKYTSIGPIEYVYRHSSEHPGYTGSYTDGNIKIIYTKVPQGNPMNMSVSGTWNSRSQENTVNISFSENMDVDTLVGFLNSSGGFQNPSFPSQVRNMYAYAIINTLVSPGYDAFYYKFSYGENEKFGGIDNPGNCNIHLDGTEFTGTWERGKVYKDPTSQIVEPWIGKRGIKCDFNPDEGTCNLFNYEPNKVGDCQICESSLWDWIPGGWEAVANEDNPLHSLANATYIPKEQLLENTPSCSNNLINEGNNENSNPIVSWCGMDTTNRCDNVCSQNCSVITWNNEASDIDRKRLVKNLEVETGINTNLPNEICPNILCERNPVLTLRGSSEEENNKLVINWMNGIFDLSTIHNKETGINEPFLPDVRAYGIPEELEKRTIKAMRCCLGLNPGFKSKDGNNGQPKLQPDKDPYGGDEMWNLSDCPPGVICPTSDTCKDLYKSVLNGTNKHVTMNMADFGRSNYSKDFTLNGESSQNVKEIELLNPAYYAKAYCEMMSGGGAKQLTPAMGLDDEINTLCRKTMYEYCLSPVEVDVIQNGDYWNAPFNATNPPENNKKYAKSTYKLPLKIFTQGCNMWFKNELQEVMPSDYGTRDMLLGNACQKLQVDGWYNPVGPSQSPLLQAFVNKNGTIKDKSGVIYDLSYIGSSSATSGNSSIPGLLANTCNCFLQGSKCQETSGSNCSYQYCGAGINNPFSINTGETNEAIGLTELLNKPVDLTPYTNKISSTGEILGDSSWSKYQDTIAPGWTTGLNNKNFTCATGNAPYGMSINGNEAGGASNCYNNCNYINEYDTCWNASPVNRKYSGELLGGETKWECDFENFQNGTNMGNICNPDKGAYSCFGDCEHESVNIKGDKFPSCGTNTWFESELGLNPNEIKSKSQQSQNRANIMDVPYWQNFYSGASEQVSSATIPGIGVISNPSRSILSSDSTCSSPASIKPYNVQFNTQSQCVISQVQSSNNQGIITGSVGISQFAKCSTDIFQGRNKYDFLTYMGNLDCIGKDEICWNNNDFCLTDGSGPNSNIPAGDNCMNCGTSNLALINAPDKPNTCCLDPSLASMNESANYESANRDILNKVTLGNKSTVSYFCSANECPVGSTDLNTLEQSCGIDFKCSNANSQQECGECNYCRWTSIYEKGPDGKLFDTGNKHCVASCPLAPTNGWFEDNSTPSPTPSPIPTQPPMPSPKPIVNGSSSNLSNGEIGMIVGFCLIILAFIINSILLFMGKRNSGKSLNGGNIDIAKFGKFGKSVNLRKFGKVVKR